MAPRSGKLCLRRSSRHEAQRAAGAPLVGRRNTRWEERTEITEKQSKSVGRGIIGVGGEEGKRNPRRRATQKILWEYLWGKKEILQ
jgi:hypothetical protein